MINVGTQGLTCPSDNDYAALALYMQRLAEQAEALLVARQAEADEFEALPTAVWANAVAIGPIVGVSGQVFANLGSGDCLFANYVDSFGAAPFFGETAGMFPRAGIWHLGLSVNWVPVGAISNDSARRIRMDFRQAGSTGLVVREQSFRVVQGDGGTPGGDWFGTEMVVLVDEGFHTQYSVRSEVTHDNLASDMNIPIGGLRAWLTYVGSADLIEVV